VPDAIADKQKEMFREEAAASAKSAEILEKIVEGKMNKWYSDVVLLEQPFVKDEDQTVEEMLKGKIATLGENMQVRRIARFQIG
jgi:elongation factor Ts